MADETRDMEFDDIRSALSGKAPAEKAPETPPAEPETTETAPPAETEEKPVEGEEKPPAPVEDENRKKRFSKITKERDAERARAAALEARLAALESAKPAQSTPAPVEKNGAPEKPDVDKYPTWGEYQTALEEYEEKRTDWKVAQALAKKEHEAELARRKADYEKVHNNWQKQVDEATEDNDDIEDAIKTVGNSVAKKGIIDVIKESDNGVKMVLYLHRNPEELAKVEGMSIASAARYLGKIEARIEGEVSAPVVKTPAKSLPKPPAQLGGAPSSSAKAFDYQSADDASFKAQLRREGILPSR